MSKVVRHVIELLDFYPKFGEDNQKKTTSGGVIAIISFIIISLLFFININDFFSSPLTKKFFVNTNYIPRTHSNKLNESAIPKMKINFDITFYHLPCVFIDINILDFMKDPIPILDGKIKMQRYNFEGNPIFKNFYPQEETRNSSEKYCGSCYSLKPGCCNTCEEVINLYKSKSQFLPAVASIEQCISSDFIRNISEMLHEKCRIHGMITVKQHPGHILIRPTKSTVVFNELNMSLNEFNLSHKINHFAFGSQLYEKKSSLDDHEALQVKKGKMKTFYFLNIVPIGLDSISFVYSSSSFKNENSSHFPSVLFKYDISPIAAVDVHDKSLSNVISQMIQIMGGIYALAAFIDLFGSACAIHFKHKREDDILKLL